MNGFVVLDKSGGMTSFRASAVLRRIYNEKKTGHTGTLDPMATGVLPVALGKATRFIDFLPDSDKAYTARFRLGIVTDTLDITGTVLEEREVNAKREDIEALLPSFTG
ncbi:MAG: pseudouridine synthase, partial [Clostridia bacterium]|nr:pseudouridine synthase [Clostridia bacterium]